MSFRYFAYASNLLTERMRINCPSATKKTIAYLKDYQLVFTGFAETWQGATATIVEKPGSGIWGVVWEIGKEHEACLERQEIYYNPITVTVQSPESEQVSCKVYQNIPPEGEVDALPSAIYKAVMVKGAIEHELPQEYIEKLKNYKDSGYKGPISVPVNIEV